MADMVHLAAVGLTAAAGLAYLQAARAQWAGLSTGGGDGRWWWIAFAAQSAGLVVSLVDDGHRGFAFGALAAWAGVAAVLFASMVLRAPGRLLLSLPLGAVALLVAVAGGASTSGPAEDPSLSWIAWVHGAFMASHLAATAVAGAAGLLYVLAASRLKAADPRATMLPTLAVLERLVERGLIWGTALLTGGLATGGAAARFANAFQLIHPTALLGLAELALLCGVLVSHRSRRLSRRALSIAAVACLGVGLLGTVSQVLLAHG